MLFRFVNMSALYPEYWPQFFTATILDWKKLLAKDKYKDEVIKSLQFMVWHNRIRLYAFAIMDNHIYLIWQPQPGQTPQKIQLSFMKYTAQQIKFDLQKTESKYLEEFKVTAKDRACQFWERNSLYIDLFTDTAFNQKLEYIHANPVKAGICQLPEQYYYSSAKFYAAGIDDFKMLTYA